MFDMCSCDIDMFREFFSSPGFQEVFDLPQSEQAVLLEDEDRLFRFVCRFLKQVLSGELSTPPRTGCAGCPPHEARDSQGRRWAVFPTREPGQVWRMRRPGSSGPAAWAADQFDLPARASSWLASVSQVSITVSGLRDRLSIPCSTSHKERSG